MKRLSIFLIFFTTISCIDIVRLKVDGGGTLVIDGLITNEPGPYRIYLSRSVDFDNTRPVSVFKNPEKGAVITISDNTGFSETLVEYEPGAYRTKNIQGVVGNSYKIFIKTTDGKGYESDLETMPAVAPLDKVDFTFDKYEYFFINSNGDPRVAYDLGFYMYANFPDPPGPGNYYRWSADGISELFVANDNPALTHCWLYIDRLETQLQISDDVLFDGTTGRQFVCMIPYDKPFKFLVKMEQESLTESAYNYWNASKQQQLSSGSLFDPPPALILGNIHNVADPSETVLGFFGASAIARKNFMLDRIKASNFAPTNPPYKSTPGICVLVYAGATDVQPPEWE